ncbi:hypothetical protein [uncultured Sphingobium sp.]|uniref:hypothetical protein n=1 Tax=uncultured Sphingobium sp. TaxID=316087 RepID=UPI0032B29BC0|tara:strand:- start:12548 stop:12835 length:288 start_codon:yes stop_codon:yes gene_type:complete
MDEAVIGVTWVAPENYSRFHEICGDDYPPTFVQFLQQVGPKIAAVEQQGYRVEKVVVDPDEMLDWCLVNEGRFDTEARAAFVNFKLRAKYGEGAK